MQRKTTFWCIYSQYTHTAFRDSKEETRRKMENRGEAEETEKTGIRPSRRINPTTRSPARNLSISLRICGKELWLATRDTLHIAGSADGRPPAPTCLWSIGFHQHFSSLVQGETISTFVQHRMVCNGITTSSRKNYIKKTIRKGERQDTRPG